MKSALAAGEIDVAIAAAGAIPNSNISGEELRRVIDALDAKGRAAKPAAPAEPNKPMQATREDARA